MANEILTPPEEKQERNTYPHRSEQGPRLNEETDGSVWISLFSNVRDAFGSNKQTPLELESRPVASDMMLHEEGVFSSLASSIRDVFFPAKLPPLVLESRPIAVVDRMAVKRDPKSTAIAVVLHALVIALIGFLLYKHVAMSTPNVTTLVTPIELPPPQAPPKAMKMGGGGGQRGPTPVTKGTPPKFAEHQIVPPNRPPLEEPKIKIQPTIEVQNLKMAQSTVPQIGVANSPVVGMSMGNGSGTGLGSGNGSGLGPGSGGNTGGGPRRVGGGVSPPVAIYTVEPEFSEEARKTKTFGNVLLNLWVDTQGNPTHIRVIRGIGMGLDEKAVEAVKQYKFKPAMENGKPVLVELNFEVNFQLF